MPRSFISRVIKSLIGRYGNTIILINELTRSINRDTGVTNRTFERLSVEALIEPAKLDRDNFNFLNSGKGAASSFSYGGVLDKELLQATFNTNLLTDSSLPNGTFEITLQTYVFIGDRKFIIQSIERDEANNYYRKLILKRTENEINATEIITADQGSTVISSVGPT